MARFDKGFRTCDSVPYSLEAPITAARNPAVRIQGLGLRGLLGGT